MLIEIPDPEIILGIMLAFLGGLGALYLFYKIKSLTSKPSGVDPSYLERMEFYERQLIDMKIRMDSINIDDMTYQTSLQKEKPQVFERFSESRPQRNQKQSQFNLQSQKEPKMEYGNTVDYVLGLITNKAMTSRDIQMASQRSREHTARLMKKLFQEGYVQRNTKTKPYTYSITEKGRAKLGILEHLQQNAA
ncbi:MAG: hypothetical protein R3321_08225 [Nitrososphaeraceae archaeon]|nr:hypothetical protein [Nitrososphaeraceae archaeon]